MPNSNAPCKHVTGKHHYKVKAWMSQNFSMLQCDHSACRVHLVVSHEEIVKRVVA